MSFIDELREKKAAEATVASDASAAHPAESGDGLSFADELKRRKSALPQQTGYQQPQVTEEQIAPEPTVSPKATTFPDTAQRHAAVESGVKTAQLEQKVAQDADDLSQSATQEEEQSDLQLKQEFAWLDNPFKSNNMEVQDLIGQMVKLWKDPQFPPSVKLERLQQLKQHTQRVQAGEQGIIEAEGAALPTTQEQMFTGSTPGSDPYVLAETAAPEDVLRTVGAAATTVASMANALVKGVADLPIGIRPEIRQWLADNEKDIAESSAGFMEEIQAQAGMPAMVAQEVGQQALTTAIRLAAISGTGLTKGTSLIKNAVKLGLFTAATTSGDANERIKAGARSATLMSTPLLAGKIPNAVVAPLVDIGLNIGLSNIYGFYDWNKPESWIPALIMDTAFGVLTKPGMGQADRSSMMKTINGARDAYVKAVDGDKANAEFMKAAERAGMEPEVIKEFLKPVTQAAMADGAKEQPARVKLPVDYDKPKPTEKVVLKAPEGYDKPYEGVTLKEAPKITPKPTPEAKLPAKMTPDERISRAEQLGVSVYRDKTGEYVGDAYLTPSTDMAKLAAEMPDATVSVKDTNGFRGRFSLSEFNILRKNKAFDDRIKSVAFRQKAEPGFANQLDKKFMDGIFDKNVLSSEEKPFLSVEPISGVTLQNNASIRRDRINSFQEAVADPTVRALLKERGVKTVSIEPPFKFELSEQGNMSESAKIIRLNADADDPKQTMMHELGHGLWKRMPPSEQKKLMASTDESLKGYIRLNLPEEVTAEAFSRGLVVKEGDRYVFTGEPTPKPTIPESKIVEPPVKLSALVNRPLSDKQQGEMAAKRLLEAINHKVTPQFKPAPTDKESLPVAKAIDMKTEKPNDFPVAGNKVDGRTVRGEIPNTSSISSSLVDYTVLKGIREVLMSNFELTGKHYSVEGDNRISSLANQIDTSREINPLIVVIDPDGPYILEGATRADALKRLEAKSFPAMVVIDNEAYTDAGYVREGDRYVFKGEPTPKPAPEAKIVEQPVKPPVQEVKAPLPDESMKLGQHAKKIAAKFEERGNPELAQKIRDNPDNWYEVVGDKAVASYINGLSDAELRDTASATSTDSVGGRSIASVAARKVLEDNWKKSVKLYEEHQKAVENGQDDKAIAIQKQIDGLEKEEQGMATVASVKASAAGFELRLARAIATPQGEFARIMSKLHKKKLSIRKVPQQQLKIFLNKADESSRRLLELEDKYRSGILGKKLGLEQIAKERVELAKANNKANTIIKSAFPPSAGSMMTELLQGSLLTHISEGRNPLYNIAYASFVLPRNALANAGDMLRVAGSKALGRMISSMPGETAGKVGKYLSGAERTLATKRIRDILPGMREGFGQAAHTAVHGFEEGQAVRPLGESIHGMRPFVAMKDIYTLLRNPSKSNMPAAKGKDGKEYVPPSVIAGKIIEASPISWIPTAMLRLLPFGDRPVIASAAKGEVRRIGETEFGLTGDALERFVKTPPPEVKAVAESEAASRSMQEDNVLATVWNNMMGNIRKMEVHGKKAPGGKYYGPVLEMATRSATSPYMKTLLNASRRFMQVAIPELNLVNTVIDSGKATFLEAKTLPELRKQLASAESRGQADKASQLRERISKANIDRRKAIRQTETALAAYAVASGFQFIGQDLAESGIVTPDDYESQQQWAKANTGQPPGTFNISGAMRRYFGGSGDRSPKFRDGDLVVGMKWSGPVGFSWKLHAKMTKIVNRNKDKPKPIGTPTGLWGENISESYTAQVLSTALDSTVAQGINKTLDALMSGNWDRMIPDVVNTMTSPLHPRELEQMNKYMYESIKQRRGVGGRFTYIMDAWQREMAIAAGVVTSREKYDAMLPTRYNAYTGEPLPNIPEPDLRALSASDPFEFERVQMHPNEKFLVEFQDKVNKAEMLENIFPTIPTISTPIIDTKGVRRTMGRDRDLLEKVNKLHGQLLTKYIDKYNKIKSNNKHRSLAGDVSAWEAFKRMFKKEFRRETTKRFGQTIVIEGEDR